MQLFQIIIYCLLLQVAIAEPVVSLSFSGQAITIFENGQINSQFIIRNSIVDCSSSLYSHAQSKTQYQANAPDIINITSNLFRLNLSITTQYNHFQPKINASSCTNNNCIINIQNNCPSPLTSSNYFDVVTLHIAPLGSFSYNLNCNISHNVTYFEYGGLVLIFFATMILILAANLGRWNSFGGYGIEYGYKMIALITSSILTVGILSLYTPQAFKIVLTIANFASIIASCSIIAIQILFFLRISCLQKKFWIKKISIRMIDILGVLTSIPVVLGWWYAGQNWIFSDILSVIMVVTIIKVFKFVSFKVALVAYILMVTIYSTAAVIIAMRYQNAFSDYDLYSANTPYQFQIPLITPSYGQKCTWVSITTIAFPGLLVSYLRRFDQSKSTRIYLITAVATYFLGSVIWWVASSFSYYSLPFDAFCEPIMILAFSMFAFKRKELRTLWEGKFFDEQFQNKNDIEAIGNTISQERPNEDYFREHLGEKLFFQMKDDSELEHSERVKDSKQLNNDEL